MSRDPPEPIQRRSKLEVTKKALRYIGLGFLDGLLSFWPRGSPSREILFVRLDAIGDFVMWQRAAVHLRASYPGKRIVLAANVIWAPLAKQLPYWDEVVAIDVQRLWSNPWYRLRLFWQIRRRSFSTVVHPTHSRVYLTGDSLVRVSGATQRIGAVGDLSNMSAGLKRIADRWYTELIRTDGRGSTEIELNEQFLHGLGWRGEKAGNYRMPEVATLRTELQIDSIYFIIFPGASWTGKQWPKEAFASLIDEIYERRGWLPVLCGSASEFALCNEVACLARNNVVNLAGKTSLTEFCEFVRDAKVLVGNDTSAIHIAAAVGTPSVCVLGGGHFGRFLPYPIDTEGPQPATVFEPMPCFGCNWNCHLPHTKGDAVPCVASITSSAVIATLERMLVTSNPITAQKNSV